MRALRRFGTLVSAARARWPAAVLRPYLVALFTAVLVGLVVGAAGQFLGWRTAGALPTDAEAAAIARLALAGPAPEPERRDELFGVDKYGEYEPGYVRFTLPADPAASAFLWQAKDIRVRLHTAGWSVDKTWAGDGPDESTRIQATTRRPERVDGLLFVADKGDWRVRYVAGPGDEAHLDIVRAEPLWAPVGALVGGLLGLGVGWLTGLWAVRRWAGLAGSRRRTTLILAVTGAIGLLPALAFTLGRLVGGHAQLSRPQVPLWTAVTEPLLQPLTVLAVLVALVNLGRLLPPQQ
jgi:hypothetical protein